MSQGPDFNKPDPSNPDDQGPAAQQPSGEPGQAPPPPPPGPYGQPVYGQPAYGQPPYGQTPYGQPMPAIPGAPYGVHPVTGIPYSDKSKIIAGILQIVLPLGVGRFYIGDTGIGVAQLVVTLVTCGIGALWPLIDGIIILASDSKDSDGRMLRS